MNETAHREFTMQSEGEGWRPSDLTLSAWPNLREQLIPSSGSERSMKLPFFIIEPGSNAENLKDHVAQNKGNYATISNFRVRKAIHREIA